nr:MAG TPA: hypothetical protein [Caudoviricetes sp.]
MKEYAFSFSNEMKSNGEKYNLLVTTAYGIYNSEKEAILEAMEMCEYYGYEFTHLVVGQAEYFTPRIDAESVLEDLAQLADDNGYKEDGYLENVKSEHIRELDRLLTETYLKWENKHPEYRNSSYLMTHAVRYSIDQLKEEMESMRKGEQDGE